MGGVGAGGLGRTPPFGKNGQPSHATQRLGRKSSQPCNHASPLKYASCCKLQLHCSTVRCAGSVHKLLSDINENIGSDIDIDIEINIGSPSIAITVNTTNCLWISGYRPNAPATQYSWISVYNIERMAQPQNKKPLAIETGFEDIAQRKIRMRTILAGEP